MRNIYLASVVLFLLAFPLSGQDTVEEIKKRYVEMNEAIRNSPVKITEKELAQNGFEDKSYVEQSMHKVFSFAKKDVLLRDVCALLKFNPEELEEVKRGPSDGVRAAQVTIYEKIFYILKYNYSCTVTFPRWDRTIQRDKQMVMDSKVDVSLRLNPVFEPPPPSRPKGAHFRKRNLEYTKDLLVKNGFHDIGEEYYVFENIKFAELMKILDFDLEEVVLINRESKNNINTEAVIRLSSKINCQLVLMDGKKDLSAPDTIVNVLFDKDMDLIRAIDKIKMKRKIDTNDILDTWKSGESWLKTRKNSDDENK